jgi:hypothetical protein
MPIDARENDADEKHFTSGRTHQKRMTAPNPPNEYNSALHGLPSVAKDAGQQYPNVT